MKILAIDDNQDILHLLAAVMSKRLPEDVLLTAPNGRKGMELALAEDPDAILLDIVMPGMDGFEVCRAVKADDRLQAIPVIFLTGMGTDRQSRLAALDAGAEGFLAKPFDEIELVAQIRVMTALKAAHRFERSEKERLPDMVVERTRELEQELENHRRTEDSLRIHAHLLDCISESVVATDLDGRILYWGRGAEKLYGFSAEEVLNKPYRLFGGSIDCTDVDDFKRLVLERGQWTGEHRQRRCDGSIFWTSEFISVVHDAGGRASGFVAIDLDITTHKQSEEKQREQLEELQRWHDATLGRENRVLELKREVNDLLARHGEKPRYTHT